MKKNIVIFGHANSGKSTLIGYLKAKLNPEFDFAKFIESIKSQNWYIEEEKFRYVSDHSILERIRQFDGKGQTRMIHFDNIALDDSHVKIIDTPGSDHGKREKVKGISFGEIGIFVIEAQELLKAKNISYEVIPELHKFFAPYYIWKKLKDVKNLVTVISKIDLIDYNEENYKKALSNLRKLCDNQELNPIPISIDRLNESDENILVNRRIRKWYKGKTLINKVRNCIADYDADSAKMYQLFCKVDKTFYPKGIGTVWRTKVIKGTVNKNDSILIGPVKYRNKIAPFVSCTISNIRVEKGPNIEIAEEGEIIGINPKNIRLNEKVIPKKDIQITPATIVSTNDCSLLYGDIVNLQIDTNELSKVSLSQILMLVWFGKLISLRVIYIDRIEDKSIITCAVSSAKIGKLLLPLINGESLYNQFLVTNQKDEFISVRMLKLGFLDKFDLGVPKALDLNEKISSHFSEYKFAINNNRLVIKKCDNVIQLFKCVKRFYKRYIEKKGYYFDYCVDIKCTDHNLT